MGSNLRQAATKASRPNIDAPAVARDRRAMEKSLSAIRKLLEKQSFESAEEANAFLSTIDLNNIVAEPETPQEKAQELMYEAFEATGKKRIELAKSALKVDPNCADAYSLLAEEEAETLEEAISLYRLAVEGGRRSLSPEVFESEGAFWSWLPTRPFMRGQAGLAYALRAAGSRPEAIDIFKEMLRLNPNDNQGVRYDLAGCLLAEGRDDEFNALCADYPKDPSSIWLYAKALAIYRKEGPERPARLAAEKAFEANPYVLMFVLVGEMPDDSGTYSFGDESEAAFIVNAMAEAWMATPDYLPWVIDSIAELLEPKTKRQGPAKPKKKRR
ncbi:MAG TPA: tetratricopeptide repeat protein [Fimbriimonadaceae bacterium]|nr:tetratricopeptide repeat protein [Fimbriimonadaceae bacterium]